MDTGDLDPAGLEIVVGVNARRRATGRTQLQAHRDVSTDTDADTQVTHASARMNE